MSLFSDVFVGLEVTRKAAELSDDERSALGRAALALDHARNCATDLPTTLDARARDLVVQKLQESEHWLLELARRGSSS